MLAPSVNARETAACETPARRATACADGGGVRETMALRIEGRGRPQFVNDVIETDEAPQFVNDIVETDEAPAYDAYVYKERSWPSI